MTAADHMIHVRVDADNLKTAKARAKADYRNNMTAYINALIAEDGKRNPKPKRTP